MPHTHGCMAWSTCHPLPEMVGEVLPAANILLLILHKHSTLVQLFWVEKECENLYLEDVILNISLATFDLSNLFSDGD